MKTTGKDQEKEAVTILKLYCAPSMCSLPKYLKKEVNPLLRKIYVKG